MSKYQDVFAQYSHVLLAVVHAESKEQALRNTEIAFEGGAHGIFLINHDIKWKGLIACYKHVREQYPHKWIGLNFLDLSSIAALEKVNNLTVPADGLWVDDGGITDAGCIDAAYLSSQVYESGWNGLLFGGVAFKGQSQIEYPGRAAELAAGCMDIITTSGYSTGIAADLSKIKLMHKGADGHPLAIASGITPENIREYMPYVDCFLVATGISISHTELDPTLVRKLVDAVSN